MAIRPARDIRAGALFDARMRPEKHLRQTANGATRVGADGRIGGYLHPGYARSLEEFGRARELPRARGWILQRKIAGFPHEDAMGCYPLFTCRDWSRLPEDLEELTGELVSLSLVADPFGDYDEPLLRSCFDVVIPYKRHYVVDLEQTPPNFVSRHHRYQTRKGLRNVRVEICRDPSSFLEEWVRLYGNLIERYALTGIRAFSRSSFQSQLRVPGTILFCAICEGETVGADWYCVQGDVAYAHLSALSSVGYEVGAAYALMWTAIESLRDEARWIALGGGPGVAADRRDGLSWFKQGWATGTRTAYFCGRILDPQVYREIVAARGGLNGAEYFPMYRAGEFR